MSIVFNTQRLPDDCVFNLDTANVKSYPGVGNTWFSLSPNKQNGTAVGAVPPIVTDKLQCFDFVANTGLSAATAVSGFSFPMAINRIGNFTLECWVKNVPTTVGQQILFSNTANDQGFRFGVGVNGAYSLVGPTYVEGTITWQGFDNTKWNHVVLVVDRMGFVGTRRSIAYLNGKYANALTLNATQTTYTGWDTIYMAKGLGTFSSFSGKLAIMRAYNRNLSEAEISFLYDSHVGRFS